MNHRTDGLKLFNFKSPYVAASWIMTIAGFFLANELVGSARRYSFEQFLKIAILGISCAAPLGLALLLDHLEEPAGTKVPDEEVENLLDFLDEREDLK